MYIVTRLIFIVSSTWKDALRDRLVLRKVFDPPPFSVIPFSLMFTSHTLTELLSPQLSKEYHLFRPLIVAARQLVQEIRRMPLPDPGPDSPVRRAFDPRFGRVIVSFIPLHVIQLRVVWDKLLGLLDSLDQLRTLMGVASLASWNVRVFYARSAQSISHLTPLCRSRDTFKRGLRNPIDIFRTSDPRARYGSLLSLHLFFFCAAHSEYVSSRPCSRKGPC